MTGRFWEMHRLPFDRQPASEENEVRGSAAQPGRDVGRFDTARASAGVLDRIRRDAGTGPATGEILGTPTIDRDLHLGSYDAASLRPEVTAP